MKTSTKFIPIHALLCICITFFSAAASSQAATTEEPTKEEKPFACSFYMAPSSIPNSGFGVYTTKTIPKNQPVVHYSDAPSIPIIDSSLHADGNQEFWTHIDYFWQGGGLAEFECDEVSENVFVLGCLSNYHTYLKNLHPHTVVYDDSYLDRSKDPGAGAFTYHEGHQFFATRQINPGEELFADYGEEWLDTREGTFAEDIPRQADFSKAGQIFGKVERLVKKNEVEIKDETVSIIADIIGVFDKRISATMPRTAVQYNRIAGKRVPKPALQTLLAKQTIIERNTTWIEENGMCLELIKPDKSTIKQAGRGAFATGFISKGSLVSPMPLNTIADRDLILMYETTIDPESGEKVKVENSPPIGEQLLVNYCFGNDKSQLLLCPMTNAVLINHCSTRSVGEGHCKNGPNAKVQWATSWDEATSEWLEKSIDDIVAATALGHRGLSLEVIATKDIAPGEEVFIDYGEQWENAWMNHVQSWKPPKPARIGSVTEFREKKDFRTLDELETNPYPENIMLACYFTDCPDEDEDTDEILEDEKILGHRFKSEIGVDREQNLFKCDILENASNTYTVRVHCPNKSTYLVSKYSKSLVTFRMAPYQSDQHLPGAFRHHIGLEDAMVPEQWKNRKVE